ncbi:MAG: winged helix DNA-binding domain-containing protein, partial [Actinomycetes bacterium]
PDEARRRELWTSRVWPGAVMVDGEIVGTWRRAGRSLTITAWADLTPDRQDAVEAEAATLPLPVGDLPIQVTWERGD